MSLHRAYLSSTSSRRGCKSKALVAAEGAHWPTRMSVFHLWLQETYSGQSDYLTHYTHVIISHCILTVITPQG